MRIVTLLDLTAIGVTLLCVMVFVWSCVNGHADMPFLAVIIVMVIGIVVRMLQSLRSPPR